MIRHGAAFLLRRLLQAAPLVAGILTVSFVLIHLAPGDPVYVMAGDGGDAAYYDAMRARYGLDRPLLEQYVRYVGLVLRGDFGFSYQYQQPALEVVRERLPATGLLCGTTFVLATFGGILMGVVAVRSHETPLDLTIRTVTSVADAAPVFWTGQLLLIAFAVAIPLFPVGGIVAVRTATSAWDAADVAWHLVLPATTLSLGFLAITTRMTRASLLVESRREYVRAALGRGLSPDRVLVRHALPNALLPVVTTIGYHAGTLLTGAGLTEAVFGWPGIGHLLFSASSQRDYPLIIAILLTASFAVIAANLITDVLYTVLDPRVEL